MRSDIDEVQELAKRQDCGDEEVFLECAKLHPDDTSKKKALQDCDDYQKTGWVPGHVRQYYRNLEPLPDTATMKFMKMLARVANNGGKQ